jgi:hypothetical protein
VKAFVRMENNNHWKYAYPSLSIPSLADKKLVDFMIQTSTHSNQSMFNHRQRKSKLAAKAAQTLSIVVDDNW